MNERTKKLVMQLDRKKHNKLILEEGLNTTETRINNLVSLMSTPCEVCRLSTTLFNQSNGNFADAVCGQCDNFLVDLCRIYTNLEKEYLRKLKEHKERIKVYLDTTNVAIETLQNNLRSMLLHDEK